MFRYSGYLIAMLLLPAIAWLYPELGGPNGPLYPAVTTKLALMLVFVLQGLTWDARQMRAALTHWKAHLFLQTFVFGVMPLTALCILWLFPQWMGEYPQGRTGLLILSVLPTTVASCTVFTRDAGGNGSLALFNTLLNNFLAIFLTPALIALIMTVTVALSPMALIQKLLLWMGLPFLIGFMLKGIIATRRISFVSRLALTFIQYTVLCNGMLLLRTSPNRWSLLAHTILVVGPWFFIALFSGYGFARLMGFSRADLKACTFTAPQKTLAVGAPLIQSLVMDNGFSLALTQLPLLVYYYIQMTASIALSDYWRWKKRYFFH